MLDYINSNQANIWLLLGFTILIVEALVLGFGSGLLLFGSIGALLTGALMHLGVVPLNWGVGIGAFGVFSGISAVVLWKPMRRLQNDDRVPERDNTSDLIGRTFRLASAIDRDTHGETRYSGVTWKVRPSQELENPAIDAQTLVEVVAVDVGVFWVEPAAE